MQHMVGVNGGDGGHIGVAAGTDEGMGRFVKKGYRRRRAKCKQGYNKRLFSVSLAGWSCRVSQALEERIRLDNSHPKDKSWSSFDSPVAVPRPARFSTSSSLTSATAVTVRFIERIGFYNPIATANEESIRIAQDRLTYWQGVGAQASPTVERLINNGRQDQSCFMTAMPLRPMVHMWVLP